MQVFGTKEDNVIVIAAEYASLLEMQIAINDYSKSGFRVVSHTTACETIRNEPSEVVIHHTVILQR